HAGVAPDSLDVFQVVGEFDPIDDDATLLVLLETVDRADEGGLARAGGSTDDYLFPTLDPDVDPPQDMKLAEPFVDVLANNDVVVLGDVHSASPSATFLQVGSVGSRLTDAGRLPRSPPPGGSNGTGCN